MKTIPLQKLLDTRFTAEQRERIDTQANTLILEVLLTELAEQTKVGQKLVPTIVSHDQLETVKPHETSLSALSQYTTALGGELSVVVKFPKRKPRIVVVPGIVKSKSKLLKAKGSTSRIGQKSATVS